MAQKLTEEFLKLIADEYRKLAIGGSTRPSAEIAEQYGVPIATARRWVHNARQHGHLPVGLSGRVTIEGTEDEPLSPAQLVGEHVRRLRTEAGLTQQEFGEAIAKRLGVPSWSRQAVHSGESGRRSWTAVDIVTVARIFGVTPGHFFEPIEEA